MCANRLAPSSSPAGSSFRLTKHDIHLWFLQLDGSDSAVTFCRSVLPAEELQRANRYRFKDHRRNFSIAHGVLRFLLARYLDAHPAMIEFGYGPKGKPEIAAPRTDLRFNLSHSGEMAAYALTLDVDIGVDIERLRRMNHLIQIATRFFSSQELGDLMALPEHIRQHAFLLCWTRKEAYIKSVGDGLSVPLDSFCVTVHPDDPARFVHINYDCRAAAQWTLQDIVSIPGYAAAVAYRDPPRQLHISTLAGADQAIERLGFR